MGIDRFIDLYAVILLWENVNPHAQNVWMCSCWRTQNAFWIIYMWIWCMQKPFNFSTYQLYQLDWKSLPIHKLKMAYLKAFCVYFDHSCTNIYYLRRENMCHFNPLVLDISNIWGLSFYQSLLTAQVLIILLKVNYGVVKELP